MEEPETRTGSHNPAQSDYYFDYDEIVVDGASCPGSWGRFNVMSAAFPERNTATTVFMPANESSGRALASLFPQLPAKINGFLTAEHGMLCFEGDDKLAAVSAMDEKLDLKQLSEGKLEADTFLTGSSQRISELRRAGFAVQADCQEARRTAVARGVPVPDILA